MVCPDFAVALVEGIGFRGEKTPYLSAFPPAPNKPSFNWDKVGDLPNT